MSADTDYKFSLNVSTGCYPTKKPDKPFYIQYATADNLTIDDLDRLQRQGKSFCYLFNDVDESGLVTQHQKTLAGFNSTSVIFYDVDKMQLPMEDYIEPLPYKPTYAYTTYSNGIEKQYWKYGYRLVYAFDEYVTSIEEFDALYYSIAAANGFKQRLYEDGTKYEFDYRKVNQQYYGGGQNSQSYKSNTIYSFSDFAPYSAAGLELKEQINPSKKKAMKKEDAPFENNIGKQQKEQAYYSDLDNPFYVDLYTMSPKNFLIKYDREGFEIYEAALATQRSLSEDGRYWIYPNNYQEVKRNWVRNEDGKRYVRKWQIGSGRKKRLYVTAQIMKYNIPDITKEELIYCLVKERYYYYDNSDNNLNNKVLIQIADSALSHEYSLSPRKHPLFSINKDYWLHYNTTSNTAKNIIRKELKERQVLSIYDFQLSVMDNLKILHDSGIKVGKSYLYALRKKYSEDK